MTQLIDKKVVLEAVKALPAELDAETVQRCIEVLSNQPTVNAVPIEWVEEWLMSQDLYYVQLAINKMIDAFRTERNE